MSQTPDKSIEDIFKNLANSSSRITLMMTALQKYQNMTMSEIKSSDAAKASTSVQDSTDVSMDEDISTPTEPAPQPLSAASPAQQSTPAIKRQTLIGKLSVKVVSAKNLVKGELLTDAHCVVRVRPIIFLSFFSFFLLEGGLVSLSISHTRWTTT